ncbi:MAG: hypothetical protein U9R21_01015 [Candidatus Thermoplasmatota archaeon]|nr:hypothetical protein [Candidatus Thermoplasmatota archaeon]
MTKKITLIIVLISIIISVALLSNWFMGAPEEVVEEETEGDTTEEILSEIDAGLLVEEDGIEIGEMI